MGFTAVAATMATVLLAGIVEVTLPPGVRHEPAQGADSLVGAFVAEGLVCAYDVGPHAGDLSGETESLDAVQRQAVSLGGTTAERVRAEPGMDGLYIPEISRSVLGPNRMSLQCRSDSPAARATAQAIIDGVRLR